MHIYVCHFPIYAITYSNIKFFSSFFFAISLQLTRNALLPDFNAGGLECRAIQWHGKDKSLGRIIFCGADDIRQLCAI